MEITLDLVKKLREKTGAGVGDCKEALSQSNGDMEKAIEFLRKKGLASAARKASRVAKQGLVDSYIHMGGKIGVLLEVNCETDFVARNEEFKKFVRDLALQIAATNPSYVKREDVPVEITDKEKAILKEQIANSAQGKGKPDAVLEKIITGRLDKFYQEVCLLEQPFVKDPSLTVKDYLGAVVGKIGENIVIRRFTRYQLGEEK
jgi:elongation factor Ts